MKKIIAIVGARPQFIKHAPMVLALSKSFHVETIHTGQHYDENMSSIFFDQLKIPKPEYQLSLTGKNHGEQTAEMMVAIEKILMKAKPDFILVYGDTNSTLAGALVASKLHIPIVHVEAGLRSFNKSMPEEINRVLTDHMSQILFCPSEISVENLRKEGIVKNVFICGDVMRDMLMLAQPFLEDKLKGEKYVFATIHRPYNTDEKTRVEQLLNALSQINKTVIFPIHPRTRSKIKEFGISIDKYSSIRFVDPVGYFEALSYQKFADCIITDSGGIQKEAYWLKKKCITVRPETEWVETIVEGWNTLVFEEPERMLELIEKAEPVEYNPGLYGNGNAAVEITELLKNKMTT